MGVAEEGSVEIDLMIPNFSPQLDDLLGDARNFVDSFLIDIQGEEIFKAMGSKSNKTFLLYGPPGTGKTMAFNTFNNHINQGVYKRVLEEGQAILSEGNGDQTKISMEDILSVVSAQDVKNKMNTLCFSYDIGKYGTAFINRGSRVVQNFFDKVGVYARMGIKTVILFDEVDALLTSRSSKVQTTTEDRKVLETIMKNLQNLQSVPNMFAILTTNMPEICDSASLRAGRIDVKYKFGLPVPEEREKAIRTFIESINQKAQYNVIRKYNPLELAELSEDFNYADLKQIVEGSVREKAIEMIKSSENGSVSRGYITQKKLKNFLLNHKKEFHSSNGPIGFKL